jgi:hypothetical protein
MDEFESRMGEFLGPNAVGPDAVIRLKPEGWAIPKSENGVDFLHAITIECMDPITKCTINAVRSCWLLPSFLKFSFGS